ncbi:MAG: hypothetical protein LBH43_17825 [Treponema sp.]|jgi:hypothetical protein|nr:hypothetical protein [Treponema sp.]
MTQLGLMPLAYAAMEAAAAKRCPMLSAITLNPSIARTPKSGISLSSANTISSFAA